MLPRCCSVLSVCKHHRGGIKLKAYLSAVVLLVVCMKQVFAHNLFLFIPRPANLNIVDCRLWRPALKSPNRYPVCDAPSLDRCCSYYKAISSADRADYLVTLSLSLGFASSVRRVPLNLIVKCTSSSQLCLLHNYMV
jgi:hypothetical protein